MDNRGVDSAIIARHDSLPFGEEIWSGTGMRSPSQGYGTTDRNRQKYGLTERDDATGLDHTWWRKYENFSGRWTSPDPYRGSMYIANPQSFNRYSYVQNDPMNFIDPTGTECQLLWVGAIYYLALCFPDDATKSGGFGGGGADGRGGGPGGGGGGGSRKFAHAQSKDRKKACEAKKQLQKCERDAREKYAFTPHGPSLDDGILPTGEDLGLSAAGGGVTGVLRLLGGATLRGAVGAAGESGCNCYPPCLWVQAIQTRPAQGRCYAESIR